VLLILGSPSVVLSADLPPTDGGRLVKWSQQKDITSKKVIIFVHGLYFADSSMGNIEYTSAETKFALKMDNLDYLGKEKFKNPTSHLAKFYLYEYDPRQNVPKIAEDLAQAIRNNPSFNNNEIAIIGHSEGGLVLWELTQKYPNLIKGGICLGAPIMSTPLVHKEVRDGAVKKVFQHSGELLIPKFDALGKGSEHLEFHRKMPFQTQGNLYFFAGSIKISRLPLPQWVTGRIKHYVDILDVMFAAGKNFFTGMEDNRQFCELLADIIQKSDWSANGKWDHASDGLVPISSALAGAIKEDEHHRVFLDYDHSELMSGKDDFNLDRVTLDILDQIISLMPQAEVGDLDIPQLPDLSRIIMSESPLKRTRFAYVSMGKIHLTDANWQRDYVVPVEGVCSAPEFNSKKLGMTFTLDYKDNSNIFLFDEKRFCTITNDNQSRSSSFSPNGGWLTYQSGNGLVVHNLKSDKSRVIVKGVNLASPPIWVAEWLTGKVYFTHRNQEGKIDIYCVSPRWRKARDITKLQPIIRDSGVPHIVRGYLGGIISTQSEWDSSNNLVGQRAHFISGALKGRYSIETRVTDQSGGITIDGNMFNKQILIETNQALRFESVLLDKDYLQIYLVDREIGQSPSIYRFDYFLMNSGESATFETVLSEVVSNASELDINVLAD